MYKLTKVIGISVIIVIFGFLLYKTVLPKKPASGTQQFNTQSLYKNEWAKGIVYQTENMAADLRRVCVTDQNASSGSECKYLDYWTNNRTGQWERIQRDNGAAEGSNFCEYFEKWKVAKGMPCSRMSGENTESFVNF